MNLRAVSWLLGCVMLLLAAFMLVPTAVAAFYGEWEACYAFLFSIAITAIVGGAISFSNRGGTTTDDGHMDFFRREGLAVVGLSWFVSGMVGALPFLIGGAIESPVDAFFESVSGFTTTGSTILTGPQIDGLGMSFAFWRSFTHWLGGIGIVLVFVVLFPTGGRSLFRSEVPGIAREAVQSRVRDAALGLVRVYVILTGLEVVALNLAGLSLFEAFLHAFGTIATGGFSNHATSVAHFNSWVVEAIIVFFMLLAGINFGLYAMTGSGWRNALRAAKESSELRLYLSGILGSTLVIAGVLWFWGGSNGDGNVDLPNYSSLGLALRDSVFAVVSMVTSTGYATADFDRWPEVCRAMLMVLALIGACAGSTGGGVKVVRFMILAKAALLGVNRFARPRAIHSVRVDGQSLESSMVSAITGYFGLWVLVFSLGTLALTAMDIEILTAGTAVLATLNNIGPGLDMVGPTASFTDMPDLVKLLLSGFMILGRLEFYAVVVLFVPRFWRT
ncbi:MAG: trk system potassium uptake protein TrkH [Planctomycetota bacterium]|jgi:trk system potassium uptake protein TrkH